MQWTCKFPSLEPWGWGSTSVNCFWGLSQALSQCWWSVTVNSLLHIDLSPVGFTSASCRLLQMLPTSSAALEGPLLSGRIKLSFLIHSCLQVLGNHNPAPGRGLNISFLLHFQCFPHCLLTSHISLLNCISFCFSKYSSNCFKEGHLVDNLLGPHFYWFPSHKCMLLFCWSQLEKCLYYNNTTLWIFT